MLGKRGPQRGLFEADTVYGDFVGRDTFYGFLAAQRFERSLALAKQRGALRVSLPLKVALDTTNILGRGAVKDTYNLLADGMRQVPRVLAGQAGTPLAAWAAAAGYGRYVSGPSVKGAAGIDWDDRGARERCLGELVADADRLLEQVRAARAELAVGGPEETALVAAGPVNPSDSSPIWGVLGRALRIPCS